MYNLFSVYGVSFAVALESVVSVEDILATVATFHGVSVSQLRNGGRAYRVSIPRQEAMWLSHKLTPYSYGALGRQFCRNKSTILHGVRAIDRRINKQQVEGDDVIVLLQSFECVKWH